MHARARGEPESFVHTPPQKVDRQCLQKTVNH